MALQEEKHQLFLQLKKVLHEEEKRRRKEQRWDWRAKNRIGAECNWDRVTPDGCLMAEEGALVLVLDFDLPAFHHSDLTTLTSAAYPQSLTVHTGTHLLSMQGETRGPRGSELALLGVAAPRFRLTKPLSLSREPWRTQSPGHPHGGRQGQTDVRTPSAYSKE